jgi:flagellar motility protein MotE (MotC chaperone)
VISKEREETSEELAEVEERLLQLTQERDRVKDSEQDKETMEGLVHSEIS